MVHFNKVQPVKNKRVTSKPGQQNLPDFVSNIDSAGSKFSIHSIKIVNKSSLLRQLFYWIKLQTINSIIYWNAMT